MSPKVKDSLNERKQSSLNWIEFQAVSDRILWQTDVLSSWKHWLERIIDWIAWLFLLNKGEGQDDSNAKNSIIKLCEFTIQKNDSWMSASRLLNRFGPFGGHGEATQWANAGSMGRQYITGPSMSIFGFGTLLMGTPTALWRCSGTFPY